jgi:phosphoribosylaminoimidazole-succinocarboxamide synthase
MPDPVPDKGRILTRLSLFWFKVMEPLAANHVITGNVNDYPDSCRPYLDVLNDRSILVKKTKPLPVECVVRGYLSGSGWDSYKKTGTVCGIRLPSGLLESQKLESPLFTPSTKAEKGTHDENISFEQTVKLVGEKTAKAIRDLSLAIYARGADLAEKKGIIIADTKFEFGLIGDEVLLIDEVLTPDSSRFWPKDGYEPGRAQDSFDKQYVRDYLLKIKWDKKPPAPELPVQVIEKTREKYLQALALITGDTRGL